MEAYQQFCPFVYIHGSEALTNKNTAEGQPVGQAKQSSITNVFSSVTLYKSSQRYKEIPDSVIYCLSRNMIPMYTANK